MRKLFVPTQTPLVEERRIRPLDSCSIDKETLDGIARELAKVSTEEFGEAVQDTKEQEERTKGEGLTSDALTEIMEQAFQDTCVELEVRSKQKVLRYHSADEFVKQKLPKDIVAIAFSTSGYGKKYIEVNLDSQFEDESNMTVEGSDANWVSGTTEKIETEIKHNKNLNGFFRKPYFRNVLGYVIGGLVFLKILSISVSKSSGNINAETFLAALIAFGALAGATSILLKWLFPYVEFSQSASSLRQWVKYAITGIIITIAGGLITSFIL